MTTSPPRLLLVEDSQREQRSMSKGLQYDGLAVDMAADGVEGLRMAKSQNYDLIILDLLFPRIDGLGVLAELRNGGYKTHVLILTAKDQVQDRIRGLQMGADDYLIKPFDFSELLARIHNLISRSQSNRIRVGSLLLDTDLKQVFLGEKPLVLSRKEYALLERLFQNRGRLLTRRDLYNGLYGSLRPVSSNVVDVLICSLRRKIKVGGEPSIIMTRRGYGYYVT